MPMLPRQKKTGWWTLELLMTTALCVIVTGAGLITMYQILGTSGGLYPTNQLQQVELSKMMLLIEDDFYNASRVYVWNERIVENSADLASGTHTVSMSSGDYNSWPLQVTPVDEISFFFQWNAMNGNITTVVSDANNKYYTLLFLGPGQVIDAVVYLTCTQSASGVSYTMTRYENNGVPPSYTGGRLVKTNEFTYTAPGASFTASDQSATTTTFPSITKHGSVYGGIVIRFPTAFSTALRDIGTGKQARRVKYTADVWSTWTFVPAEAGRWVKQ